MIFTESGKFFLSYFSALTTTVTRQLEQTECKKKNKTHSFKFLWSLKENTISALNDFSECKMLLGVLISKTSCLVLFWFSISLLILCVRA